MSEYTLTLTSPRALEQRKRTVVIGTAASEDAAVMSRFMDGDDDAFAELFDRHNGRLYLYCLKLLGDSGAAEDLTQELWERVIRLRRQPQEIRNPAAFLLRIARNLCLNQIKLRRHTTSLSSLPESAHPADDDGTERSEMEEAVHRALAELSFDHREVLVLNAYCGYRYEEIAAMLGKSSASIWMRASRARTQLRKAVMAIIGPRHPELRRYLPDPRSISIQEATR